VPVPVWPVDALPPEPAALDAFFPAAHPIVRHATDTTNPIELRNLIDAILTQARP